MSENILNITDAQFQSEVLESDVPVIVDFWAPWCGPCKMIAPILADVADEFEGKVKVVKLNVDENTETAPKYNVRGIPTLIIVKGGEVAATKVGAVTKSQLIDFVQSAL
ncbi:thioredoxin TrxA [Marinomonas mediterranea]|jgi:thioredoxin|uniref:Thioredoxin n=1 Tax=Marinomonas mediterranea (strain ATCC 700492 / JCM 21426 / NBRC 103028 / MMB-1) TaxID=717774 RepID=F2K0S5_MARM1|nr:thioredoxin TrxA [Marinomonas mediterranea]ADZ92167.1 thioredoxin [Marinomonas mediterranea MMB-1]WCN10128.1 thioredoxin TrxA [Marinomonas mediterranea]WCN14173.1 thioredoxin TrxA [Marinomonas mediterranea]WCN18229.1 thioredoxin TrxA [Marinomonas mediterranea MMB-1]